MALPLLATAPSVEAATQVFYSVGISRSTLTDLSTPASTVTIAAGVATFSPAQPVNVGVGDEVSYGGGPTLAYLSSRLSSTQFTVTDRLGAPAGNVTGATVNRIYRAFADLSTAEANSSDGGHLGTTILTGAGNYQLNWPCYDDGPIVMGNTLEFVISGYTTGPANFIRVYTPTSSNEVGVSQRHRGVCGTGFRLEGSNADTIQIEDDYVRIEGLTIQATVTTSGTWGGIWSIPGAASDIRISHNIIKDVVTAGNQAYGIVLGTGASDVNRVWNNVVFNVTNSGGTLGIGISIDDGFAYVFNNTLYNCETGIRKWDTAVGAEVRNNASIHDVTLNPGYVDYYDLNVAPAAVQSHNVSSDATATGTGSQTNKTAYATYFVSTLAGDEDLHLRTTSLNLWNSSGMDLSAHANLPVTDDIDGMPRLRPDIGADELGAPGPHMLVTSGRYSGTAVDGQAVFVGWQPDVVMVKRASGGTERWAVLRTSSMSGDNTKDLDNTGLGLAANLVQSLTPSGFTVGDDFRVNENGVVYYWVAFRAAAGELKVDFYAGNGAGT